MKPKLNKAKHEVFKEYSLETRDNGEGSITHPMYIYKILRHLHCDSEVLVAALLHDTIEDEKLTYDYIKRQYGEIVAKYVEALTKQKDISIEENWERLKQKGFIFPWVIVIKIADRLHNVMTSDVMDKERRLRYYRETLYLIDNVFSLDYSRYIEDQKEQKRYKFVKGILLKVLAHFIKIKFFYSLFL